MAGLIELWVRKILRDELTKQRIKIMADLNAALDQLTTDISAELQQLADAIAALAPSQAENEALQAQLTELSNQASAAADRVAGLSAELQADDPAAPPTV